MSNKAFFGGFLQAFTQAKQQKQDREEAEQEKKAKVKLFELQLAREQRAQQQADQQQEAQNTFFREAKNKLGGVITAPLPGTGVELGDVEATMTSGPPPSSLVEMLADPQMALRALQANIPLPAQAEDPLAKLEAFKKRPDLFELQKQLAEAGGTKINLAEQGLSKVQSGLFRPDPTKPGLAPEPGAPPVVSAGQQSLDQAFGTDAATWVSAGGFADTQKSILQLGEAKKALESVASGKSEDHLTGPLVAKIPEFAKPLFNPKAIAVRESVEEIVQRNLRLVLGAQFTEKEGERLIARAYNENLSETENAKRVGRLMKQLQSAAQAKQEAVDYFTEHGTLAGFKGKVWTLADFDPEIPASSDKEIDFNELPD